jgi:hypothetical protein
MTDGNSQQIRVPMVYSFEKDGSEKVVVRFDVYVRDFNELAYAERHFKAQLDQRYKITENKSRINIQTLTGEPVHESGIS